MSAANLPDNIRKKAILIGMGLAAFFRIFFAAIASFLLAIPGILFFGGCLLLWVCWRFYLNIKTHQEVVSTAQEETVEDGISDYKKLLSALTVIAIADVSMSIDNVIAVAAIAREDTKLLIFGLILAIAFMALFSTMFMRLMIKYSFLSWLGLIFLIYLSVKMLYDGLPEIIHLVSS